MWGLVLAAPAWILLLVLVPPARRSPVFPALAAAALSGSFFLLQPPPDLETRSGKPVYSVYQHNVWIEVRDSERELAAIKAADTDFVALVEAWPDLYGPHLDELKQTWPYAVTGEAPPAIYTRLMLLSKYPVISSEIRFPRNTPAVLRARVRLPEGDVTVLVVHFTRPWPFKEPMEQIRQLEGLEAMLDEIEGNVILLGDFNSAAWGRLSRRLQARNDFRIVNHPRRGTWPALVTDGLRTGGPPWPDLAGIPIDLSFCRGELKCGGHTTLPPNGSDHYAVRFKFVIPATPARSRAEAFPPG